VKSTIPGVCLAIFVVYFWELASTEARQRCVTKRGTRPLTMCCGADAARALPGVWGLFHPREQQRSRDSSEPLRSGADGVRHSQCRWATGSGSQHHGLFDHPYDVNCEDFAGLWKSLNNREKCPNHEEEAPSGHCSFHALNDKKRLGPSCQLMRSAHTMISISPFDVFLICVSRVLPWPQIQPTPVNECTYYPMRALTRG
jgi:hypothetical protein